MNHVWHPLTTPILPVGTLIDGRYELRGLLGAGGFAMVYRAWHVTMERMVALKLLNASLPEEHQAHIKQRFEREARVLASFEHPGVVTVHEFGVHGDERQPYIVMQLLDGVGLDRVLNVEGALSPARAFRLLLPCLSALDEAHRGLIIHKDLKPSNLVLVRAGEEDERLVLLDFGAAALGALPDSRLTDNGEMIGTPQYFAPEYIKEHTVTTALDVYQAGLILLEMLTGRRALEGFNSYMCMMAHCRGEIPVPEALAYGPLGPVLARALAIEARERYQTAGEFLEALQQLEPEMIADLSAASVAAPAAQEAPTALIHDMPSSLRRREAFAVDLDVLASRPRRHRTASSGDFSAERRSEAAARQPSFAQGREAPTRVVAPRAGRAARTLWFAMGGASVVLMVIVSCVLAMGGALAQGVASRSPSATLMEAEPAIGEVLGRVAAEGAGGGEGRGERASKPGPSWVELSVKRAVGVPDRPGAGPSALFDGDPETSWRGREGQLGRVEVVLEERAPVVGLVVVSSWGGAAGSPRGRTLVLTSDEGQEWRLRLSGEPGVQRLSLPRPEEMKSLTLTVPSPGGIGELQIIGLRQP